MDSPAKNTRSRKRLEQSVSPEPVELPPVRRTQKVQPKQTKSLPTWSIALLIILIPYVLLYFAPTQVRNIRSPVERAPLVNGKETETILYFFGQQMDWNDIASSPYTLTLLCFGDIPADNMFAMRWPAWCKETSPNAKLSCKEGVEILHKAGKKIGISIGGGDSNIGKVPRIFTTSYTAYVAAGKKLDYVTRWATFLADWVKQNNLDAIDFDNEEAHTSWTGGTADPSAHVEALADKDGLDFMGLLQVEMRKALGPDKIFAVSLQPPFYCPIIPVPDPGATNPMVFPVVPLAPWYQNYMYIFETNKEAYDALTYMIFMYYPNQNMWEWTLTNNAEVKAKYTNPDGTDNLIEIYKSQIQYTMKAGQVGKLDPKKMVIATQVNEPTIEKAYIPAAQLRRQLATLTDAERPAGLGVWVGYVPMNKEGCEFTQVACEFSGKCPAGTNLTCPPAKVPAGTSEKDGLNDGSDWGVTYSSEQITPPQKVVSQPSGGTNVGKTSNAQKLFVLISLIFFWLI